MSSKPRSKTNIRRKVGGRHERRRILVVTEGTKTEPEYFDGLARAVRATGVSVAVATHGTGRDPAQVVADAVRRREGDDFDECWAVVDVDEHASLPRAVDDAVRQGVSLAVSNRCFEIWLRWHFDDHTAHVSDVKELIPKLARHRITGKRLPSGFPFHDYPNATRRARAAAPDTPSGVVGPNPSSSVWYLVHAITTAGAGS